MGENKNNLVRRAEATLHEQKTLAEAQYSRGGRRLPQKCQMSGFRLATMEHASTQARGSAGCQPALCSSVFGKPASHQQGQRTASPGRAQVEPSGQGECQQPGSLLPSEGAWRQESPWAPGEPSHSQALSRPSQLRARSSNLTSPTSREGPARLPAF